VIFPFLEDDMADHGEVEYATATGNDYPEHEATYHFFLKLVKWNLIAIVIILVLMAYFLT
jgi:hypothetical protein